MSVVGGDPFDWPFWECFVDVTAVSACRIIWDIHFILVHRRVFKETLRLIEDNEQRDSSMSSETEIIAELIPLPPKFSGDLGETFISGSVRESTEKDSGALKLLLEMNSSMGNEAHESSDNS